MEKLKEIMKFKKLLEPPTEYYLLDCEFATELDLESREIRIVPLEIAIGHYLNGKMIRCLSEYLYWPNMLARDLKRGINHSGFQFSEYMKKGQVSLVIDELNSFTKKSLPFVGWNIRHDLDVLCNCLDSLSCLNSQAIQFFSIDQYLMERYNLNNFPGLRDTINQLHLPLAKVKDIAITDVEMTAEVYAYFFNRNELSAAMNQLTKKTVSQDAIISQTEMPVMPTQLKLMNGRVLSTIRLPKAIYYVVCTGRSQKMTSEQAERLRKWLTNISTSHRLIQCTKPVQADIGIYVGNAKSFAEIPDDLVTAKIKKLQRAGKPIISLVANN